MSLSRYHLSFLLFVCSTCLSAGFPVEEQLNQLRENYVRKDKINIIVIILLLNFKIFISFNLIISPLIL
jgi:hypothetical protein